jgi:hypothetical protein
MPSRWKDFKKAGKMWKSTLSDVPKNDVGFDDWLWKNAR